MNMERRYTPPIEERAPQNRPPNSLQNTPHAAGGKPRSSHAETKQRIGASTNAGRIRNNNTKLQQTASAREEAARQWVTDTTPPYAAKRKRPLHHPLGVPSLASPSGTHALSNSSPQQQRNKSNPRTSQAANNGDGDNSSNDSIFHTAQKTALQCVDYASKRQAAAKAALTATTKISTSLQDLMGDSNRALTVARQSRLEAENAAVRAEGAAKKVKEANELAAKDKERASLELDEANAQAEEAWEFLRRVKGTSRGHKKENSPLKTTIKPSSSRPTARIGTFVEVCEGSNGTNCSSVANHPLSPRKRAGISLSNAETKALKSGHTTSTRSRVQWRNQSTQIQMKMPSQSDAQSSGSESALLEPIRKFKGHTSPITKIAAVDKNRFISSSWDKTIRIWDATTGECLRTFRGHTDWVHAISVLDSKHFISGSDDRSVKMWNVDRSECIRTFTGHSSFVKSLAPMSGERFLSGSRDRTIKLFSVASGECVQTFMGHVDVVSAIVALDSHHFVSGSHDNTIKYWNDSSGTCVRTLLGHTGSIKTLAAVSDKEIVSGSDDRTIRLWETTTGTCLREFGSKNTLVFSLTYICEGFFLSCGGNSIKLYHIPSGTCVKSYETPRISLAVVRLDDERFVTGSDQMLHLWKF